MAPQSHNDLKTRAECWSDPGLKNGNPDIGFLLMGQLWPLSVNKTTTTAAAATATATAAAAAAAAATTTTTTFIVLKPPLWDGFIIMLCPFVMDICMFKEYCKYTCTIFYDLT